MGKGRQSRIGPLRSLGVDMQAKVAVVLLSLVPSLVCFYAGTMFSGSADEQPHPAALLVIFVCTLTVGIAGWMILQKYARNISRLRNYVVNIAQGSIPETISLYQTQESNDLQCIEDGLNLILSQMNRRIKLIEHKLKLESDLRKALEDQQQELLTAERQRVMLHSLGAACHHLGQPVTALRMRLYLLRDRVENLNVLQVLDESVKDLDAIESILTKLRDINVYRTELYIESSKPENSRILAI